MAKDLAEEQCCMAQRCGTQATKEHWGQIICDLELTRFSTIERERESGFKVLSSFILLVVSPCAFTFTNIENCFLHFVSHFLCFRICHKYS